MNGNTYQHGTQYDEVIRNNTWNYEMIYLELLLVYARKWKPCMDGRQCNFGSDSFSESKPGWYSTTPREAVRGWPTIYGMTNFDESTGQLGRNKR